MTEVLVMSLGSRVARWLPRSLWLFAALVSGMAGLAYLVSVVWGQISLQRQIEDVPITPGPMLTTMVCVPLACLLASLLGLFLAPRAGSNGQLLDVEPAGREPRMRAFRILRRVLRVLLRVVYWLALGLAAAVFFFGMGYNHFTSYVLAVHGSKLSQVGRHSAPYTAFYLGVFTYGAAILFAILGGLLAGVDLAIKRADDPQD